MSKQKTYKIKRSVFGRSGTRTYFQEGTLDELKQAYSYTLEVGQSWAHEPGNKKVNTNAKSIKTFMKALNQAADNTRNGDWFELVQ